MRRVLIVLFDGVQSLDVTGPLEVFAHAQAADGGPAYEVRTASLRGQQARASSGLRLLPDDALACLGMRPPDLLIIPGGPGARHADPELVRWVRDHAGQARRLASVCTGAFLLAEAGLLAGRRVTTHWGRCAELAAKYRDLTVDPDPIFIKDGNLATSAGVTAGIDLALALIEDDLGRDTALAVARQLVMFLRRPGGQAQFSAHLAAQSASRQPLREVQQWIAEHPEEDLSVPALAQRAHLSERQFARAFAAEAGVTPGRYVDQVRIEAARRRLEDTPDGIEETARACGYGTPEAMRRAFLRGLGVSPAEYRRRFQPA
jgi:transcriptional regulator GlxA family with amidase domain